MEETKRKLSAMGSSRPAEVIQVLKRMGYSEAKIKPDSTILAKEQSRVEVFTLRRELHGSMLRKLLRRANISEEEFRANM